MGWGMVVDLYEWWCVLESCHGSKGSGERVSLRGHVAGDVVGGKIEGVQIGTQSQLVQRAYQQNSATVSTVGLKGVGKSNVRLT